MVKVDGKRADKTLTVDGVEVYAFADGASVKVWAANGEMNPAMPDAAVSPAIIRFWDTPPEMIHRQAGRLTTPEGGARWVGWRVDKMDGQDVHTKRELAAAMTEAAVYAVEIGKGRTQYARDRRGVAARAEGAITAYING